MLVDLRLIPNSFKPIKFFRIIYQNLLKNFGCGSDQYALLKSGHRQSTGRAKQFVVVLRVCPPFCKYLIINKIISIINKNK